ncbi:HEAT repeat domain-containing protein [Streptomyces sp. NPDC090445]|uniref:HEAT repeat domain-containing protein n=1 Tax=Streptomyces sp. NPDC090445 TaxID=3365963 RepID=UPI0037FB7EFA
MGTKRRRDAEAGRTAARQLLDGGTVPVGGVLPHGGPEAWLAFDEQVRSARVGRVGVGGPGAAGPGGPGAVEPGAVEPGRPGSAAPGGPTRPRFGRFGRLRRPARAAETPLELLLCHPDGRVREAALGARDTPLPLPLVVIRCTDWVPRVRTRARRVLVRALAADARYTVSAAVPLVLRLGGREQGGWAVELFEAALRLRQPRYGQWWEVGLLTGPPSRKEADGILAGLRLAADLPTRRFAARISLARGLLDLPDLARHAAAERDPATARLWADTALKALAAARAGTPTADAAIDTAIDALLAGPVPTVRSAGVTALRAAGRAAEAERYLADRSALVRACARRLVDQDGGDPHARYRRLVTDPAGPSPYAVAGLAECGRAEDVPLLRELLGHPVGRVRAAALAGLRQLGSAPGDAELLALLDDPAPSVAREACLTLLPMAGRLDPGPLAARCTPRAALHVRRAAFRLLRARGGSEALRAAVALSGDWEPKLRGTARATVRGRHRQPARFTGEADRAELATLLRRVVRLFGAYESSVRRAHPGPAGSHPAPRKGGEAE